MRQTHGSFDIATRGKGLYDFTAEVVRWLQGSGIRDGLLTLFVRHTSASLIVQDNADPDVQRDVLHGLQCIFPREGDWRHFEGNSDAHIKTSLTGVSVTLPVRGARPFLGTWQAIYFAEFDGPRSRHMDVTVVPGVA